MSNSNFDTKFLFQIAQANNTESSNTIKIDSNSNQLLELPSFNLLSPGGLIGGGIAGVLLILAIAGFVYTRLYRIIKPNESIIRSGGFGPLWSGKSALNFLASSTRSPTLYFQGAACEASKVVR